MKLATRLVQGTGARSAPYVGGIGSGGFEVRADGTFTRCLIFNDWRTERPLDAEFVHVGPKGQRILRLGDRSSSWGVQQGVSKTVLEDEFPFVRMTFPEVGVKTEFWSPFIPGNINDSTLPAVFVRVKSRNRLVFILRGRFPSRAKVKGNTVFLESREGTIALKSKRGKPFAVNFGHWRDSIFEGRVPKPPKRTGRTVMQIMGIIWNGGADDEMTMAWHYPNSRDDEGFFMGHRYVNRYRSCRAVLNDVTARRNRLRAATERFSRGIFGTRAPGFLKDAMSAQLHSFVKQSWLTKDGKFGVWEGSCQCCGLQTTDVAFQGSWLYFRHFPELERSGMRLTAKFQRKSDGWIPHFFPGTFTKVDEYRRKDMNMQFVMMAVRDWLFWKDKAFLREMYPTIKKAMLCTYGWDINGDGIPEVEGKAQTYDAWGFSGTTSYLTVLWLGALRAAAVGARALGDKAFAARCEADFPRVQKALIDKLWNGRYFDLGVEGKKRDRCCMVDGLAGDWFCRLMGLGGVVPDQMVRKHLASAWRLCRKRSDYSYMQSYITPGEEGWCYINGGYPDGRRVCFQQFEPWTGSEYDYAIHLALMGQRKRALKVVKDVQDRKVKCGMTYNHLECGGDYYRPMVIGAFWDLLAGQAKRRYLL